jgi:hypothetical protein
MGKIAKIAASSALDLGMAAFAATAAGFVMFAMPNWQFDRIVELSGLPLLLAAAQPPLGTTARAAAVIATALGTWTLVWLVLRALSTKPLQPTRKPQPVEIDMPVPRLRRADSHPDAPARAPIFAEMELGRPLDHPAGPTADADEPDDFLFEGTEADPVVEPIEPYPAYEASVPDEPFDAGEPYSYAEDRFDDPQQEEEEEEEFQLNSDPADFMEVDVFDDPALIRSAGFAQVDEPAYAPAPAPARAQAPVMQSPAEDSIAHLMQRLELGLQRREQPDGIGSAEPEQSYKPAPEVDQRLRSAIDDLQRLAGRG